MYFLIGVDDTDNKDTRGTGYRARRLGELLQETGFTVEGITRHQLLVDPRIPYTSHNSSACLVAGGSQDRFDELAGICRSYLQQDSAPGSDAGLGIAPQIDIGSVVREFGQQAKQQVLTRAQAVELAQQKHILLEGLTGDGGGVIGALAAIGLRAAGNDGRFIWLPGVRELDGVYVAEELIRNTGINDLRNLEGASVPATARIDTGPWPRPILREGQAVLLVEQARDRADCDWQVLAKETIKQYSD